MANWQSIPNPEFDRRERVAVRGGWLVKEWRGTSGRMHFVEDAEHGWDGQGPAPDA